jgi:hypothetical protein
MARRVTPQLLARLVAVVFVVVGVLGFVPAATDHSSQLRMARESGAELFGVFRVSVLHNTLHLAFGVLGLIVSRTAVGARLYLVCGGIAYLGLWVYGAALQDSSRTNVLPANSADNWLHLVLAGVMLGLGSLAARLDRVPAPVAEELDSRGLLENLERAFQTAEQDEALATLAWLAGRSVRIEDSALHGARRRTMLLHAAGGDPHRDLVLDGRAVTSLAAELDTPGRRAELAHGLERLRGHADGLPLVSRRLSQLITDEDLAWRALACGLLAEELDPDQP